MPKTLHFLFFAYLNILGSSTTIFDHHGGFSIPLIHPGAAHHHRYSESYLPVAIDVRGPLEPSDRGNQFFLNVSIGEPPVPQLLLMDTGSDLSWVHCNPCQGCLKAVSPTYDPMKSSSYSSIPCSSQRCTQLYSHKSECHAEDGKCRYEIWYGDGTNTTGTVGYEKFTFMTFDDGLTEVPNAIFGCGERVHDTIKDRKSSGILGLGASENSIISTTGYKKFSYCIGNISDPDYQYNKLIIGDGAIIQGDSTPMAFDDAKRYYVRVEGISIGEVEIEDNLTMIIDTGTSLSYLPKFMMDPLKAEVRRLMDGLLSEVFIDDNLLCYNGDMRRDLRSFPTINLWFAGGLILELDVEGVFFPIAWRPSIFKLVSAFCLAFVEANGGMPNMIGVIAQQYCNVGFNLEHMSVSFQRIDCELLET